MKKFWKILIIVLLVLLVLAGGYVAYVFLDYHRIPDNQTLDVYEQEPQPIVQTGQEYRVLTWNIGFGAYEDDYGFFMDGGTESWAWSEDRLKANLAEISNVLLNEAADIYFLQEVDFDSTRTYHVDERPYLYQAQPDFCKLHAVNYDSPFLLYPLTQPHGASRSCLLTMAGLHVTSAVRRSLPVETGFTKLLDLDRCYSVARVPVENGHELVLYDLHLSAYSSDGTIADEQLELLLADMQAEYEAGNYVVGGGDFNKDLLPGGSTQYFGVDTGDYTWAQPIRTDLIEATDIRLIAPVDPEAPVASCRNADGPYAEGQLRLTVDGFLVSPNVEAAESEVIDLGFANSDHNPVRMTFRLMDAE